jgi:general secretion pathway protein L
MPLRPRHADPPAAPSRPHLALVGPADAGLGEDALALPGELALMLRVPLPLPSHRQRQAAVVYAVEDLIAEPLDAAHVVLGPELGAGEYLAVVVAHRDMETWAARTGPGRRLVPDVLAVPVPAAGACAVREIDGRVLVRRADGTGYAARADRFEAFWRADGAPQIVLYGGRLPDDLPVSASGLMPAGPPADVLRFDLLQGPYARARHGTRRLAARLGVVAALALAAHGAIVAADTFALGRIAQDREAALRAELSRRLPGLPEALPLDVALLRALPQAAAGGGGFLPLMARASEALGPMIGEVAIRNLAWDAEDGGLALQVEAPDLETLQGVEAALEAAGLSVSAGVATTGDGAAEARYVVRDGGA